MPFRGFVAVDVGAKAPLVALSEALRATGSDLKVVRPENLHVTLKFLGWTEESALPALEAAMREAVAGEAPFTMRVTGAGTFPERGAPRVYWVGLQDADALGRVAERLEAAVEPLGWARERRPFRPHLTVARARSPQGADRARAALATAEGLDLAVPVDRVVLYRSDLARAGPTYTPLLSVPLEG